MTVHALPGTRPVASQNHPPNPVERTQLIRDALGRAHYERMATGMAPALRLPTWDDLSEATRETYRSRLDYVLPRLTEALDTIALLSGLGPQDRPCCGTSPQHPHKGLCPEGDR